jgi:hypothetical protein
MGNTELKLDAPWPEVREKIKENVIELTDADLNYKPGEETQLLEHLARKLEMTPEEVRSWIESISANKGQAS